MSGYFWPFQKLLKAHVYHSSNHFYNTIEMNKRRFPKAFKSISSFLSSDIALQIDQTFMLDYNFNKRLTSHYIIFS